MLIQTLLYAGFEYGAQWGGTRPDRSFCRPGPGTTDAFMHYRDRPFEVTECTECSYTLSVQGSSVERSGAAQGLAEAFAALGPAHLDALLPSMLTYRFSSRC